MHNVKIINSMFIVLAFVEIKTSGGATKFRYAPYSFYEVKYDLSPKAVATRKLEEKTNNESFLVEQQQDAWRELQQASDVKRKKVEVVAKRKLEEKKKDESFLVELQQDAWRELQQAPEVKRKKVEVVSLEEERARLVAKLNIEEQNALKILQKEASDECSRIQMSQKHLDRFRFILKNFYFVDPEFRAENRAELFVLVPLIMPSMLNRVDPVTGQSIAHLFTPLHWDLVLLEKMRLMGVDFSVQTGDSDMYFGSTLGHNVAGQLVKKRVQLNNGHEVNVLLHQINNAQQCIAWLILHYPEIENLRSLQKHNASRFQRERYCTINEVLDPRDWIEVVRRKDEMMRRR